MNNFPLGKRLKAARKWSNIFIVLQKLMALSEHISQSQLVKTFFTPRIEDVEWEEPKAK